MVDHEKIAELAPKVEQAMKEGAAIRIPTADAINHGKAVVLQVVKIGEKVDGLAEQLETAIQQIAENEAVSLERHKEMMAAIEKLTKAVASKPKVEPKPAKETAKSNPNGDSQ